VKTHADHTVARDDASNFKLLVGERVDFIPADLGNGLALVDRLGLQKEIIPLRNNPIKTSGIYVMFSKKTTPPELVERFSNALKNFRETPAYSALHDQYFGEHRIGMGQTP
jgi:ABC-type amino acid transport substrate-binding protein